MRYTYTSNIPWSQYATWYNNINDQKKNELDEDLSEALQLGAKSYTEYKAMKEREEKRKSLQDYLDAQNLDLNNINEDDLRKVYLTKLALGF